MKTFIKQIIIYIKLHKNYRKAAKIKSLYIFIYTMPIFGFFLSFVLRAFLALNSKILNQLISHNLFLSTVRYLNPNIREKVANILPKYNSKIDKIKPRNTLANKNLGDILKELKTDGVSYLGRVFNNEECKDFRKLLENQIVECNKKIEKAQTINPKVLGTRKYEFDLLSAALSETSSNRAVTFGESLTQFGGGKLVNMDGTTTWDDTLYDKRVTNRNSVLEDMADATFTAFRKTPDQMALFMNYAMKNDPSSL